MARKMTCCRCKETKNLKWANYMPYCPKCLHEKSKGAESFEEAVFPEEITKRDINSIKKRLDRLEKEVKKLSKK